MITYEPTAGESIKEASSRLRRAAKGSSDGQAKMMFNGIEVVAKHDMRECDVVEVWKKKLAEEDAAWRASPEGKAQIRASEEEVTRLQHDADTLMMGLRRKTDMDLIEAVDWICQMQAASYHIKVRIPKDEIVSLFGRLGYMPGENVGPAENLDDETKFGRWLVGQGLDCLSRGYSIHGIIHHFSDQWKEKFKVV